MKIDLNKEEILILRDGLRGENVNFFGDFVNYNTDEAKVKNALIKKLEKILKA